MDGAQLAETYRSEPLSKTHYLEPKLDGLRAIAICEGAQIRFISRNGNLYSNTDFPRDELAKLGLEGIVLDGELYAGDWNQTASICRTDGPHPDRERLTYIVFDIMTLPEWEQGMCLTPLGGRREALNVLFEGTFQHLQLCPFVEVDSEADVWLYAQAMTNNGFEGAILKDPDAPYRRRRWNAWRKVKFVQSLDLPIIGVAPGKGKYVGTLGALKILHEGVECEVGTGFTDAQRHALWKMYQDGQLLGKIVEVNVQEITKTNKLRFPAFVRMREDKND